MPHQPRDTEKDTFPYTNRNMWIKRKDMSFFIFWLFYFKDLFYGRHWPTGMLMGTVINVLRGLIISLRLEESQDVQPEEEKS